MWHFQTGPVKVPIVSTDKKIELTGGGWRPMDDANSLSPALTTVEC